MPTKPTLVLTFELHAERQRVFDALTQPRHLDRYLSKHATVDLQVGGRFNCGDSETGQFLKVAVPQNIVFTYKHDRLEMETEVDIKLLPSFPLGGTRMRIVHKGLNPQKVTPEIMQWLELRWKYLALAVDTYVAGDKPLGFDKWKASLSPVYAEHFGV